MAKTTKQAKTETEAQTQAGSDDVKHSRVTPLKKITVKAVCGKIKVADIPDGGELLLCRMAGIASGTEHGESTYGEWAALTGQFAATNYITGELFVGKNAFVPAAMGEALVDALETALKEDANSSLKFSVDISVAVSPRDEDKYEYFVRPVLENNISNEAILLLTM